MKITILIILAALAICVYGAVSTAPTRRDAHATRQAQVRAHAEAQYRWRVVNAPPTIRLREEEHWTKRYEICYEGACAVNAGPYSRFLMNRSIADAKLSSLRRIEERKIYVDGVETRRRAAEELDVKRQVAALAADESLPCKERSNLAQELKDGITYNQILKSCETGEPLPRLRGNSYGSGPSSFPVFEDRIRRKRIRDRIHNGNTRTYLIIPLN